MDLLAYLCWSEANATTRWRITPIRASLRTNALPVFGLRPTDRTSMAQGLFKVGPGVGPLPTRAWYFQHASSSVGIFLKGAPQSPGDKPNPSEEGQSLGGRPLVARSMSSYETHPTGSAPLTARPAVIYPTPHQRTNMAQGRF